MKKYIAYLLVVCLLLNMFPVQVFAEGGSFGKPIKNEFSQKATAFSILAQNDSFSQLSNEEKQILTRFFGVEISIMEKIGSKGYALKDALDLAIAIANYKYNLKKYPKELVNLSNTQDTKETVANSVYGEPAKKQTVAESVYSDKSQQYLFTVSDVDIDQIIEYAAKGYQFKDVTNAWEISKLFELDLDKLIRKSPRIEPDIAEKTLQFITAADEQEIKAIQQLADRDALDLVTLDQYRQENDLTWQEIISTIQEYKYPKRVREDANLFLEESSDTFSFGTASSGEEENVIETYFRNVFSYKQNDQESISLSSGTLAYEKNILSIPGRNGLDLNIDIIYNSAAAALGKTSFRETLLPGKRPYSINGTVKAHVFDPNLGWEEISIGRIHPDYLPHEEISISYLEYFFDAYNIARFWEGLSFYKEVLLIDPEDPENTEHHRYEDVLMEYTATITRNFSDPAAVDNQLVPFEPEKINNYIGAGWSFKLPYINIDYVYDPNVYGFVPVPVTLNLGNGTAYDIDIIGLDPNSPYPSNGLFDYTLNDMKLRYDPGSFSNGEETSAYVLIYKDETKVYFSQDGNLIGIADRYGNIIKYFYFYDAIEETYTLNRIEDTLGRETIISSSDSGQTRTITITPPDQRPIEIHLEKISGSDLHVLTSIKEPLIPATTFEYDILQGAFSTTESNRDVDNSYAVLTKVVYPTGGESKYTYEKTEAKLGFIGSYEYYRIKTREDIENNISANIDTYFYTGNHTGYPADIKFSQFRDVFPEFEQDPYVRTIQHGNGTESSFTFNGLHQIMHEKISAGGGATLRETDHTYNVDKLPVNQIQTRYDDTGSSTFEKSWEYNDYGDLLSYVDPLGHATVYTYEDNFHQVTSVTSEMDASRSQITEFIIDPATGNIDQKIQHYTKNGVPASISTYYTYDAYGNLATSSQQKEGGQFIEIDYEYNPAYNNGYLTKTQIDVTDYLQNVETVAVSYTYDFDTGRTLTQSVDNKTTTFNYDDAGRLIQETYADSSSRNIDYDDLNKTITLTLENGHIIKRIFDDLGRPVESRELRSGQMITVGRTQYNNMGQVSWIEDAKTNRTQFKYDGLGRVVKVTNPDNTFKQIKYYDGQNKKIEINEELAESISYYDKVGNLTRLELKNGAATYTSYYDYDYAGNMIYEKDAKGFETSFGYDELNRLTAVINPKNEIVFYEYDNLSNLTKIIQQEYDSLGQLTTEIVSQKKYDELGRIIQAIDPLNKSDFFKYDKAGNLVQKKDKNDQTISYTYDNRNRILTQIGKDHNNIIDNETTYDYSRLYTENILTVTHNGRATTYEYYSNGVLKKEAIQPDGKITEYEYDENGNRSKMTDPFGLTVDYLYDSRNRLDILTINNQKTFTYNYYDDGMIQSVSYPTAAVSSSFTYDDLNRLATVNNAYGSHNDNYSYQYDPNHNIIAITENSITTNYNYDELNRLKLVGIGSQETTYGYDARGNRTKMAGYISSIYIDVLDLESDYSYNTLNQLVQFTDLNNTLNAYYQYDHKGLRFEKTVPAEITRYYYDNTGRTITETDGTGALKAQVVWGHKPLVRIIDGQYYYYLYNGHGDVVQIVDENGNILNSYKYDEWGNILEKDEQIENPIRYAGEYYDEESGLYYLRARYYDPSIGRFITRDSYEGQLTNPLSLNLYTYVLNNPLIYIDPSGHDVAWASAGWKDPYTPTATTSLTLEAGYPISIIGSPMPSQGTGKTNEIELTEEFKHIPRFNEYSVFEIGGSVSLIYTYGLALETVTNNRTGQNTYFISKTSGIGIPPGAEIHFLGGDWTDFENPEDYAGEFYQLAGGAFVGGEIIWSDNFPRPVNVKMGIVLGVDVSLTKGKTYNISDFGKTWRLRDLLPWN